MLTEDEKARIKAEEVFRGEVREALAGQRKQGFSERIWSFLNSAFGLWLLSAVILTGLGGVITWWQHHQSEQGKKAQHATRLREEIECRIVSPLLENKPDLTFFPNRVFLAPGPQSGCFAEFSEKNLVSLYDELALSIPESELSGEAGEAAKKAQLLHAHWVNRPLDKAELAGFLTQLSLLIYWKASATTDTLFVQPSLAPPDGPPFDIPEEEMSYEVPEINQADEPEATANPAPTPEG